MEPADHDKVRWPSSDHTSSAQITDAIFSLNEAWLRTLDEYVIDTPLSRVLLPVTRVFFSAERLTQFCWRKGVVAISSLPISLASSPNSRGRDPNASHGVSLITPMEDDNPAGRTSPSHWPARIQRQCR